MGEIKIFKTQDSKQIRDYFKKYELETLNMAGIIDNVPEAEIFTDSLDNPSGVLIRFKYFNYLHTKSTKFLDEMFEELKKQHIFARKYFYPIMTDLTVYHSYRTETPQAKFLSEHVLCLPMYPMLSKQDIQKIVSVIKQEVV